MKKLEEISVRSSPKFLRNPYLEWAHGEGVPVIEDFGVDLLAIEPQPWPRFGLNGAIVHLKGRGDFISVFLLELPPGAKSAPQRHLYEQVVYVLSGHGSTTVASGGAAHTFEWGPGSLFALPLNVSYRHFNGSGSEPARLSVTNNFCVVMNLFRKDDFIFSADHDFVGGTLEERRFSGDGEFIPAPRGRFMWESNFVSDLNTVELISDDKRGMGSATLAFILADVGMHAHCALMPVGTYKKAHKHGPDYHVHIVDGEGYSLLWYEGAADRVRIDWKQGWIFAPPDQMFHQHFNTCDHPVRYMATALGNSRYPFTEKNRRGKLGVDVSVKKGGLQIEFEDQDPDIHRMYLLALEKSGVRCEMPEHFGMVTQKAV